MKLCKADQNALLQVVYWASAIRTDLESLVSGNTLKIEPMDFYQNSLRCLGELDKCVEGVLVGINRRTGVRQDGRTMQDKPPLNGPTD